MITIQLPNESPMNLRGFATVTIPNVLIPQVFLTDEDKGFVAQCCYDNLVLAGGSETYQNDITSLLFKAFDPSDTIDFFLEKDQVQVAVLNDNTYGTLYPIGSFTDFPFYAGIKLDWASVLTAFGEGNYRIKTDRVLITGSDSLFSINYHLKTFSSGLADNTIWIEWVQNGQIIDGLDYTGLNWYQAIRLPGFFGNKQAEFEEEVWKNSNYETFQIRNELLFNRICEIGMIPSCLGDFLPNLLQANTIQITDYNIKNFDYQLLQKVVRLSEINETKYNNERQAVYFLTFKDRTENHIKINC